jgi:hypothetical protein
MPGHVWNDGETELEVLDPNSEVFNVFMDNIGSYPKGPDDHHFVSLLVEKAKSAEFIALLAEAMGVKVWFAPQNDEIDTD